MVKAAAKRSNTVVPVAAPAEVTPKKTDFQLQSMMNFGDNLEEFLAICAHLPNELKEDLKKVAALSEETHRLTAELSREQAEILERAKAKYRQMAKPEQVKNLIDEDALQRTREKRRRVDHGVTEKVSITKKMYGALDACIKSIDDEIDKLEKDVKDSYGVMPDIPSLAPEMFAEHKKTAAVAAAALAAAGELAAGPQTRAGVAAQGVAEAALGSAGVGVGALAAGGGRSDLVSSNEPVYCVCRQIGWGDMIGCDNEDCEHGEWFHYHCVGLEMVDQKQLNFWLCPGCSADAREKEKREKLDRKAASTNTTPVTVSATTVKFPENDDQEEEENDNGEQGGMRVDEVRKQDQVETRREGQKSCPRATEEAKGSASDENGRGSPATATSTREGSRETETERGSRVGGVSTGEKEAQEDASPKGELPAWKGFGGMGNNSLLGGTVIGGELQQGEEKQVGPGGRGDRDQGVSTVTAPVGSDSYGPRPTN